MTFSDTEMMELGRKHPTNIHNTRSLIRTLKYVLDICRIWKKNINTHTDTHTRAHTHARTDTRANTHTRAREYQKLRSLNNNWSYIKVNDAVLIHEDNAPRHLWVIGRIIELIKSKSDNEVRRASVKFPRTVERYNGPSSS